MRNLIEMQKKLVPDMLKTMQKRYDILRRIGASGTIGRRSLAMETQLTERVLRAELDTLRALGLLDIGAAGMTLSGEGRRLVDEMGQMMKEVFALPELEQQLCAVFGLKMAVVVPGDSDASEHVKQELGRMGAQVLRDSLRHGDVVAVMGGSTMHAMASQLTMPSPLRDTWFVPARGGIGENVDHQANTIASELAKRAGGQYRMLHIPDHLPEEAYMSIMQEPSVREVVDMIRSARILVHGIGDAVTMAERRKVAPQTVEEIRHAGAVAEAFGYYFDAGGNVVYRMATAALRPEDIKEAGIVIGIAGGASKGKAIAAVLRFGHGGILVTDEAAAQEALRHA